MDGALRSFPFQLPSHLALQMPSGMDEHGLPTQAWFHSGIANQASLNLHIYVLVDLETAVAIPPPGNCDSRASTALQAPAFRGGPSVARRTGGPGDGPANWENTHR
jgi:hypothetical protein